MKITKLLCCIFCLFTFFTFSECKKNNKTPLEQLPPETQTGANTFACLVDGQVFIPKGDPFGGPVKRASYQFLNGGYSLLVNGIDKSNLDNIKSLGFSGDSLSLTTSRYTLSQAGVNGSVYASFTEFRTGTIEKRYYTNQIDTGQITIKKLDEINQIISGTFWFDAIDTTTGKVVQIREGRFDMQYVR